MIQEIPYAIHAENPILENDLPVSIEIVPHKAIVVYDVIGFQPNRNQNMRYMYKYCVVFFTSIPLLLVLISLFLKK